MLVEAVGLHFDDATRHAAIERTKKLLELTGRLSFGRSPIPEVWLCVPANAHDDLRTRFPDVAAKWVGYQL